MGHMLKTHRGGSCSVWYPCVWVGMLHISKTLEHLNQECTKANLKLRPLCVKSLNWMSLYIKCCVNSFYAVFSLSQPPWGCAPVLTVWFLQRSTARRKGCWIASCVLTMLGNTGPTASMRVRWLCWDDPGPGLSSRYSFIHSLHAVYPVYSVNQQSKQSFINISLTQLYLLLYARKCGTKRRNTFRNSTKFWLKAESVPQRSYLSGTLLGLH